ncbi:hypothetical protein HAX54_033235, partial [Datura stramonium]|nr:hypothetical protein [Datura stramonium]
MELGQLNSLDEELCAHLAFAKCKCHEECTPLVKSTYEMRWSCEIRGATIENQANLSDQSYGRHMNGQVRRKSLRVKLYCTNYGKKEG